MVSMRFAMPFRMRFRNRLQTPPPGLGALQIGVPPQVGCVESPQGLIDSIVHEE